MSRLAKRPIAVPSGVEVSISGQKLSAKGPKGTSSIELHQGISAELKDGHVFLHFDFQKQKLSFYGLERARVWNLLLGVKEGFKKELELVGVGYKAMLKGSQIDFSLGFSHPMIVSIPEGISVTIEKNTMIQMVGKDKQQLGQFAASIRAMKPPEPYKGKGIKYKNEYIRKKAGKSAKK